MQAEERQRFRQAHHSAFFFSGSLFPALLSAQKGKEVNV